MDISTGEQSAVTWSCDADDYDEALAEEDGLTAERAGLRPPVCPRCSPLRRSAALLRRRAPPPGLQGDLGLTKPAFLSASWSPARGQQC